MQCLICLSLGDVWGTASITMLFATAELRFSFLWPKQRDIGIR